MVTVGTAVYGSCLSPLDNVEAHRAGLDPSHADDDDERCAEEVHDPRRLEEEVHAWRH